jgi:predicted outer membrane lipoprotein
MQSILLSCAFGAVATMVLWVVSSAAAKREQMMRRGGRLAPPEEF